MATINQVVPTFNDYSTELTMYGQVFHARKKISRADKEAAAVEIVALGVFFDEKHGICYDAINYEVTKAFVIAKYYTDIDTEPYNTEDGWYVLYEMLVDSGAYKDLLSIIYDDYDVLCDIETTIKLAMKYKFTNEHSLSHKLSKAIDSILIEPGLAQTVDGARQVNSNLIDMFDKLGGIIKEEKPNISSGMFAKKEQNN